MKVARFKPFRLMAMVLALVAGFEVYGILKTQTYEKELQEAKAEYIKAWEENQRLKAQMTPFFLP